MELLLIEDDVEESSILLKRLSGHGIDARAAADGGAGLDATRVTGFDVILLDVMLPTRDGFSVLQSLRGAGNPTPVVVCTACGSLEHRLRGFELGADDYIQKPFEFDELLARIRAVVRRASRPRAAQSADQQGLRVGDLEIDILRQRAIRAGRRLNLTPKEFSLLSLLARHCGETLNRTTIAEQVWEMKFDGGTNVVDVHVRRLRSKVDDPFEYKLIQTVRGVGYVLEDRAAPS